MFPQALSGVGVKVTDAVVLLDREQGGADCLKAKGVNLHRCVTWEMECDAWCQGLVLVEFCKNHSELWCGLHWLSLLMCGVRFLCWWIFVRSVLAICHH